MALSDTELILEAQKGNSSAFEELVYRYDRHVLSIAMKYSGNNDDAKDIYQEVFIRIYKALNKFRFQSEFSTWVFRITTNVCLTYKAREKRRTMVSISPKQDEEVQETIINLEAEGKDSPDKKAMDSEVSKNIELALKELTPKQRMCFTLKHMEGYKLKEIAVMLECQEGTVKKYLFDAIRKIRLRLKEYSVYGENYGS
jgi:RNA polymerase sigma-70 factor (ECF subfamily)